MISFIYLTLTFLLLTSQSVPLTFTDSIIATFEDNDSAEGRKALINRDYSKALERFSRLAARKPNSFDAHYYIGIVRYNTKKYVESLASFQRAAEIDPKASSAQYELGIIYLEMKNFEAADKQFRWLYEHDQELALYLQDAMPPPMLERYSSSPTTVIKGKGSDAVSKVDAPSTEGDKSPVQRMTSSLRPEVTYKEKARYTEIAHKNCVQGTVVLNVVFTSKGKITDIRVVRALPDGLTRTAIDALKEMRFKPAKEDGEPVSVRGNVEFNFTLY